ncbi:hypothetical protein KIPB_000915 [Kipferlia bialata]|uniref:Uncharacterized protein n=1 Tax=Kipferlia bialata TaxID=797122 RepID=A0A9K3CN08_9EUKA|nr:hypothetical protein KIPB_000915 [Kipferlia bialata]|eukprot:g915.t1
MFRATPTKQYAPKKSSPLIRTDSYPDLFDMSDEDEIDVILSKTAKSPRNFSAQSVGRRPAYIGTLTPRVQPQSAGPVPQSRRRVPAVPSATPRVLYDPGTEEMGSPQRRVRLSQFFPTDLPSIDLEEEKEEETPRPSSGKSAQARRVRSPTSGPRSNAPPRSRRMVSPSQRQASPQRIPTSPKSAKPLMSRPTHSSPSSPGQAYPRTPARRMVRAKSTGPRRPSYSSSPSYSSRSRPNSNQRNGGHAQSTRDRVTLPSLVRTTSLTKSTPGRKASSPTIRAGVRTQPMPRSPTKPSLTVAGRAQRRRS